uniref:CCA tRNA nucleotidyltransferase 1, mitochondrial n=2 Tax=Bursaphelenchus xylophilus TaxID=6326 RepID=A0A1I7RRX8_BURXY
MKLSGPTFDALFTEELKLLYALFGKNQYELRIAGGPVRDLLMGIKPEDIDLATTATPTQMKELFEKENIRMLHKKGEEHGTITCRLNDKENYEITTLRIDVVCDGRRAEVEYTTDWKLDAFRRDLTINSLFLGLDGTVYDYTGGTEDIKARRVRFVGDAEQRIQEDYLRIFRYFRFFGRIADRPDSHCKATLETIKNNREGIKSLSGERIWTEFKKILVGRFASELIRVMVKDCDLAEYLALPSQYAREKLDIFKSISMNIKVLSSESEQPLPSTVLAVLLENMEDVNKLNSRLKLSTVEKSLCEFIVEYRDEAKQRKDDLAFFRDLVLDNSFLYGVQARDPSLRFTIELLKYIGAKDTLQRLREWSEEEVMFPVNGLSLMTNGVPKGPKVKAILNYLHDLWKASDCKLTEDQLIHHALNDKIPSTPPRQFRKRRWVQIS